MKVILSTRNPSKAEQIQALFVGSPIEVITLTDAGIEGEAVEDGKTLQENALKKAFFAWDSSSEKTWAMADDTGLFIDALNGEPGIKTARWAGEGVPTEEITRYALKRMEGIVNRAATFETVVAIIDPIGKNHFFSGKVRGVLMDTARVKPQPKMPFSPLFQPEGDDRVWAEMTTEEENAISHRGKAFSQARKFLEEAAR